MTPQQLVHTARQLSPTMWKGQQTVVRRLCRTNGLPQTVLHEAIRLGVKRYLSSTHYHDEVVFRPNRDTPPDIRAQYLRAPSRFGIARNQDVLGWAQEVATGTILKMQQHLGIATYVLLEREHPEACHKWTYLLNQMPNVGIDWLKKALIVMPLPWKKSIFETVATSAAMATNAYPLFGVKPDFLARFMAECEYHGRQVLNSDQLKGYAALYDASALMDPCISQELHRVYLHEGLARLRHGNNPDGAAAQRGANNWHARAPDETQCMALAALFDEQLRCNERLGQAWLERKEGLASWITMMGTTADAGARALDIYNSVDPSLLTFSTIAQACVPHALDTIDNVSELLCL